MSKLAPEVLVDVAVHAGGGKVAANDDYCCISFRWTVQRVHRFKRHGLIMKLDARARKVIRLQCDLYIHVAHAVLWRNALK